MNARKAMKVNYAKHSNSRSSDRASNDHDLVCFSHLRWNFVFQRPQHLLSRYALERRVFFIEEPIFSDEISTAFMKIERSRENVVVATPQLPSGWTEAKVLTTLTSLSQDLFSTYEISKPTLWFYSPLALKFAGQLKGQLTIYDCMDELSMFQNASEELIPLERKLLKRADLVFTGGQSLFEAKRHLHKNIHPFPSSIDFDHFAKARSSGLIEARDQQALPAGLRVGFYGVLDERLDLELLKQIAILRPEWQLVMIGPVVKINPANLPSLANIHYLGKREYAELPAYLKGWDAAILPFAKNDATRFISPTKTPEYLAAGCPVVSTSIRDVVRPYGDLGLVEIADEPTKFVESIEHAIKRAKLSPNWRREVDHYLSNLSWDLTQARMSELEQSTLEAQSPSSSLPPLFQEAASRGKAAH